MSKVPDQVELYRRQAQSALDKLTHLQKTEPFNIGCPTWMGETAEYWYKRWATSYDLANSNADKYAKAQNELAAEKKNHIATATALENLRNIPTFKVGDRIKVLGVDDKGRYTGKFGTIIEKEMYFRVKMESEGELLLYDTEMELAPALHEGLAAEQWCEHAKKAEDRGGPGMVKVLKVDTHSCMYLYREQVEGKWLKGKSTPPYGVDLERFVGLRYSTFDCTYEEYKEVKAEYCGKDAIQWCLERDDFAAKYADAKKALEVMEKRASDAELTLVAMKHLLTPLQKDVNFAQPIKLSKEPTFEDFLDGKIGFIKEVWNITGWGLKESKEFSEGKYAAISNSRELNVGQKVALEQLATKYKVTLTN